MSLYYSVTLVNVKAILHSAVIVKIIFHPHNPMGERIAMLHRNLRGNKIQSVNYQEIHSNYYHQMHQVLLPASVRPFVRPSVRLCLDTVDESQRRRHGVTAAIAVDVVAVRVCPSVS